MENDLEKLEFGDNSQKNENFERALDKYISERSTSEELEMMELRAKRTISCVNKWRGYGALRCSL